jgi:transaldolase / glucose-6-phosphate isomerase
MMEAQKTQETQVRNPLKELSEKYDQAVWLDYIRRKMLNDGELKRLVDEDGLSGVTSNPAIFEKAIGGSDDYDTAIAQMIHAGDLEPGQLFERLAVDDVRKACEILAPVYKRTGGADGFVSIEVSPYLAYDTQRTIEEARRLWREVDQPNLMVKVPGTPQGLPAIQQLISEGININITLLFSQQAYKQVVQAYILGLEALAGTGGDVSRVASVASFFVSRIDTMADKIIADKMIAADLQGKVAIANAKLAYQIYLEICESAQWKALAAKGAKPQRLLWASTGTKNPAYPPTLYVDELIGRDTVNTMPPDTLNAYRSNTSMHETLTENVEQAKKVLSDLEAAGISLDEITTKLVADGVTIFADAADKLLATVALKRQSILGNKQNTVTFSLGTKLGDAVSQCLEDWRKEGKIRRLWDRDSKLWTGKDESKWLDWLDCATGASKSTIESANEVAQWAKQSNFKHAVLLGMGGSSLGAEVLGLVLGGDTSNGSGIKLHILDSTDPAQIKAVEESIDYASTLFIVSSKSGTTMEPNLLKDYFFTQAGAKQFIAITDPGSALESQAKKDGFAHIYPGVPGIGGRYSVLSNFGMIPAAVAGIDVQKFLNSTATMTYSCGPSVPPSQNPGVQLGAALGISAAQGRDKITILTSPSLSSFGSWLEQLFAESTGKEGHGLIPVAGEPIGAPEMYGTDRLFIYIKDGKSLASPDEEAEPGATAALEKTLDALEKADHPVIRITINDPYQLGQEFFRFEIATAVAGSIIGINAFNQPDVEASKEITRQLTAQYEREPSSERSLEPSPGGGGGTHLGFCQQGYTLKGTPKGENEKKIAPPPQLKALFNQVKPGDYVALLAYVQRCPATANILQSIRNKIMQSTHAATCLGFGPRFLHSTGQLYKGGPNTGVFLQITCDDAHDLTVPGHKYTFGMVKAAQAQGDMQVLIQRDRRVLPIHLGSDVDAQLETLEQAITEALSS